jgi:hypothetical protein
MKVNRIGVKGSFFLLLLAQTTFAGSFWQSFEGKTAPSKGQQVLVPESYKLQMLDQEGISRFLSGLNTSAGAAEILSLPTPEGKMRSFKVWKTPILAAALQSRFTQIQTFTATALDNPRVTAKIDYTTQGFHAMVFDGEHTFFIDPYSNEADGYYQVYYKRNFQKPEQQRMVCELGDGGVDNVTGQEDEVLPIALKENGSTKRTYRLALSCTGEYAQAVGGSTPTTASVLSAMVTTMNRVNGIYERELSVTMELIANNDAIVYIDPNTDPFTANNSGNTLLGQNQMNTTNVIGSANYDIGHIFSTGGGGVAFLGSVCGTNQKARGVTGSANPVGDPFDVDYVAHEMGHQFGASHTFNRCSGTESASSAYEPGSGSTILAYAGICGQVNNLQGNSDAYFHAKSLDAISDFITISNGSTCGVTEAGTQPPVLPPTAAFYLIPYRTPFEIMAPEATADVSDQLLYCWEQWDLGDFQQNENVAANFTEGPSYRSYPPDTSRIRIFPKIDSLVINKASYRGERLPNVARTLNFRATVRNIINGWGTFNISEDLLSIDAVNTGEPFTVTAPNATNISWTHGAEETITWNVAQTDVIPINCASVDIYLSTDGGFTYPIVLASAVPNNGTAVITVPVVTTTTARVKVKGADNIFFDISNWNFAIKDSITSIADVTLDRDVSVYPNPVQDVLNIKNDGGQKLNLVLFNGVGQKVWEGKMQAQASVPVATYARGLYYLSIRNEQNGGRAMKKVTLQ